MPPRDPKQQTPLAANMWVQLLCKRLKNGEGLPLPKYHSAEAAGFDLMAAFENPAIEANLRPGHQINIGTGFAFVIPPGFSLEIRPRSGLAFHHGVTIQNAPGTIDADYRGEIIIMLARPLQHGSENLLIKHGDRIAQALLMPIFKAQIELVDQLDETPRGDKGLGSTGV